MMPMEQYPRPIDRPPQLVWFKRDLRVQDHRPLAIAAERGPVIPLYVIEPELWVQPGADRRPPRRRP